MGYVGAIGSSRYVSPNDVEKGVKSAPKTPVRMPRPVRIPPPPSQSNSKRP